MKSWVYMGACFIVTTSLILTGCQSTKAAEPSTDSNQSTASQNAPAEKPVVETPAKEVAKLPDAFKGTWIFKEDDFYYVTIDDTAMLSGDSKALYTTEKFEVLNYNEFSKKADLKIYSYQEETQDKPVTVNVTASLTLKDDELIIYYDATQDNEAVESVWIKKK